MIPPRPTDLALPRCSLCSAERAPGELDSAMVCSPCRRAAADRALERLAPSRAALHAVQTLRIAMPSLEVEAVGDEIRMSTRALAHLLHGVNSMTTSSARNLETRVAEELPSSFEHVFGRRPHR